MHRKPTRITAVDQAKAARVAKISADVRTAASLEDNSRLGVSRFSLNYVLYNQLLLTTVLSESIALGLQSRWLGMGRHESSQQPAAWRVREHAV